VITWFRNLFGRADQPTGPPRKLGEISRNDVPLSSRARWTGNDLEVTVDAAETVRLFDVPLAQEEQCRLELRFEMANGEVKEGVYAELWVRVPGRGEFFSKGLKQMRRGATYWSSCALPFVLRSGQRADLLKFNLVFKSRGSASLRRIELYSTPL
jgi:hypothetical protein